MVLVGLEPEEECPILFLRLRKAYAKQQADGARASRRSLTRGLEKLGAERRPGPCPGDEARVLAEHDAVARGAERSRARSCSSASGWPPSRVACPPRRALAARDRREAGLGAAARR